jgi:hypothetical protein
LHVLYLSQCLFLAYHHFNVKTKTLKFKLKLSGS